MVNMCNDTRLQNISFRLISNHDNIQWFQPLLIKILSVKIYIFVYYLDRASMISIHCWHILFCIINQHGKSIDIGLNNHYRENKSKNQVLTRAGQ